ncbi:MAG: hypothetical protein K8S56_07365, partial [Candidatus Cloacimonetes bacterium]|nr:hypothetical protein [Candidatus Cloacimonadota bacterium]
MFGVNRFVLILLITGCSFARSNDTPSHSVRFEKVLSQQVTGNPVTAFWSDIHKTLYVMDTDGESISFYRNGKLINKIGGA